MTSLQEQLLIEGAQLDIWSTREKLSLASAVVRNGDEDWELISQTCKEFSEPGRPMDWFSQMNCALQYAALLEAAETPKRKKRNKTGSVDKKDDENETRCERIVRILTQERCAELQRSMAEKRAMYLRLKEEIAQIDSGLADDRLEEWALQSENERKQKEIDAQNHALWLKQREEKNARLQASGKLNFLVPPLKRKIQALTRDLVSTPSVNQPDLGLAINSQLRTTLNVDILAADADVPNQSIPISPLLMSLLKTSSPAVAPTSSSTLQDAAQSRPGSSQMTGSLLDVSQSTRLVPQAQASSTASAPRLSQLYEKAGNTPSKSLLRLTPRISESYTTAEAVHHPQHKEMRVSKETESDEILEVVEVEQHLEFDEEGKSDEIDLNLEEIIADLVATETDEEQLSDEQVDFVDPSSDSLTLIDSVLQSMDIGKVKSSDSSRNVIKNISEVSAEQTKEQPAVENDGANVIGGMLSVNVDEIDPIVEDKQLSLIDTEKTNLQLTAKLYSKSGIASESLNTKEAKPEADLQMAHDQTTVKSEKLYPETLCTKDVAQSEVHVHKISKEEVGTDLEPERKKLNLRLSKEKSSQNHNKNSQNTSLKFKLVGKFDDVVKETSPKQKDPKINVSKVKKVFITNFVEGLVCQTVVSGPTKGMFGSVEVKREQPEDLPCGEIKACYEEGHELEEQNTDIEEGEVQAINSTLPQDDSKWNVKEEYSRGTRATQETEIDNETESWTQIGDIDRSLLHSQSPASILNDDEKDYRAWKKAIMLVWSQINSHKYSSIFLKPISDDQAPHYSTRVKRPIDLVTIKKNIESGAIRSTTDFQRDILLMFVNAQMYNSSKHDVHNMAKIMQEDSIQLIKDFVETQKIVQSAHETTALRRETRTTGTDTQRRDDSDGPRTPLSFKRKRVSDIEKSAPKKPKFVDSPNQ